MTPEPDKSLETLAESPPDATRAVPARPLESTVPDGGLSADADTAPDFGLGRVGPYVLRAELRRWRHGGVFHATHVHLKRDVELQLVDGSIGEADRTTLLDRARRLATADCPFIDRDLLEVGITDDGQAYLARELVCGSAVEGFGPREKPHSTADLLYPNPELAALVQAGALALAALETMELVHGRISPTTLCYDPNGRLMLFGVGSMPPGPVDDPGDFADTVAEWVCPPGRKPRADHWADDVRRLNPGVSRDLIAALDRFRHGDVTAAELSQAVDPLVHRRLIPCSFADRGFSLLIDACVAAIIGFVGTQYLSHSPTFRSVKPAAVVAWSLAVAVLYFPLVESLFGITPFRRLRGFRLVDRSGERPSRARLLARAAMREAAFTAAFACGWAIVAWTHDYRIDNPMFALPLVLMALYYLPALLGRTGLSPHDKLTGVFVVGMAEKEDEPAAVVLSESTWKDAPVLTTDPNRTMTVAESSGEPSAPLSVKEIDQYDVDRLLGEGGMASVYLVHDRHLGRQAALKVVRAGTASAAALERFRREAELSAQIDHPHVAKVIGAGRVTALGDPYLVMEFLPGKTLAQVASAGPVNITAAWEWITQAALGLRAADRLGIVHRDVKPSNLMLTEQGTLKVTDFGISKAAGEVEAASPGLKALSGDTQLTRTGALLGTPMFMSPEQADGRPLDRRSDMYSLGLSLLNLLTGKPPYAAADMHELLKLQATTRPHGMDGPVDGLTHSRREVLERVLAKDPAARYPDYDALIADLRRVAPRPRVIGRLGQRFWAEFLTKTTAWIAPALVFTFAAMLRPLDADPEAAAHELNVMQSCAMLSLNLLLLWVYVFGVGWHGSTLGKRLMRLRVVRLDGEPIGLWRALLRYGLAYPHGIIDPIARVFFVAGAIDHVWLVQVTDLTSVLFVINAAVIAGMIQWGAHRRAPHDFAAGTVVVRLRPDEVEPRRGWRWWLPW